MRQLKLYILTNLEAQKHAHKMFTVGSCHSFHKSPISCLASSSFRSIFLLNSGESSNWQPMTFITKLQSHTVNLQTIPLMMKEITYGSPPSGRQDWNRGLQLVARNPIKILYDNALFLVSVI